MKHEVSSHEMFLVHVFIPPLAAKNSSSVRSMHEIDLLYSYSSFILTQGAG